MKSKRVGVAGGTPTWRRGVTSVLADADYSAVEYETLADWQPGRGGVGIVFHVEEAAELETLPPFRDEHPHVPILVVTPAVGLAEFAAAIRSGASSVIGENEPVAALTEVLEHVILGRGSAPITILHALAMRIPVGFGEVLPIDEAATSRLRALANGSTVAELAADSGYSEREMFRLLNDLYARLGVRNRTDAIRWAERNGLLDEL